MAKHIPAKAVISFRRPEALKRTFGTQVYSEEGQLKLDEGNLVKYAGAGLSD